MCSYTCILLDQNRYTNTQETKAHVDAPKSGCTNTQTNAQTQAVAGVCAHPGRLTEWYGNSLANKLSPAQAVPV